MILTADALAFDMDGTLVDSHPVILAVWADWAARHNLDPAEVQDFCHGRPTHRTIAHFRPDADPVAETDWILSLLPEREEMLQSIPGAAVLLAALDPGDWALVTSAPEDLARRWMTICDLPLPPVLITADHVSHPKPDPQPFAMAAEALGRDPARVIALEDSAAGLASARAAGMATIGLGGAQGSAASLADYRGLRCQPGRPLRLHLPDRRGIGA